ncbi:hypothetical protein N7492_004863 [Penicillium capsulatum]|uniref:Nuclear pore complex subunit Nup133 n=1 Tax=Penicillium capsulatum TaxID=69766 RepID=A0A9W9LRD6_9EURO|nr:hypothetical protein N7492_004863 [Penicillium capsulatum]KAJ6136029.1 hypothetical protein N7512_001189 [Penicillium capsulatum]
MFHPKASSRNSRRRPRTSSDDSVKPPKAKRQRSVLRQAGDASSAIPLRDATLETSDPVTSALSIDQDPATNHPGGDSHLPIRNTKPSEESTVDLDGTIVLSSTDYYTVDQLPALPDQIRGAQSAPLKCFFTPGHHQALALTSSHAITWPYSVPSSTPSPSETFTVPIPESCRDLNGALPLGVLLSTATGECPGLLVIIPSTGKIIYWETVSSAASLGLSRQKQSGIQGSVSGLLTGEYATEIMNCEPSGVIITFSSGRVAHITLRDSQGKPSVVVNFLRSTVGTSGGGILGGLKSVLGGGSWRREVAAVQAGACRQRGQRDVIIATSTGLVEIWDTHWNHGNALKRKFEVKDDILAAIPRGSDNLTTEPDFKIMDFAFAGQCPLDESGSLDSTESWRLFLLVRSPQWPDSKTMFIVQLLLSGNESRILSTHPVDLHTVPDLREDSKPRILLTKSESTAFVLIEQSFVLLSLSGVPEETPTSQLLADTCKTPTTFQDIIHLRSGKEYEILGHGPEDWPQEDNGSCVVMIRNFGVIRINVAPRHTIDDTEDNQITAKHKLEQAIFFGTMARNPLNLAGGNGFDFPASEIEQASLEICEELLRSESRFVTSTAISIDQNLRLRAKALSDLAALLLRKGNPLSRAARWELLWGAEKLAAQRAMWRSEETLKEKSSGLLGQVIDSMNDKFKTRPESSRDETDPVRHWFLRDSHQMEHVIPWIKNAIKSHWSKSPKQARKLSEQLLEASELFLSITETAYRYRDEHASLYGLADDFVEDGVLADGYKGLPEFWTSRAVGYSETSHLLDWELDICLKWGQQDVSSADAPDGQVLKKIAENSARHLGVLGQMHRERARWLTAQGDPKLMDECVSIEQAHVKERKWQLFKLAGISHHLQDALSLAERFRDMEALVELVIELQDRVKNQRTQDTSADVPAFAQSEADVGQQISQYFDRFGEPWADAYFSRQVSLGNPGALLSMRKYQSAVTRFLRKTPAYSKLSWINDINGEDDFETAATCLKNLALENEKQLWCHRVEISLAKLGKLAACERSCSTGQASDQEEIKRIDDHSEIDEIQNTLHAYIKPLLEGAIDHRAEAELALDHFGKHIAEDRPSLHELLGESLSMLVHKTVIGAGGLIDLLTLMGPVLPSEEGDSELCGREFFQALRVLGHSRYSQQDPSYVLALRKLIWRRCMIKDDWEARGKAAESSSGNSDSVADDTALYQTLWSCSADAIDTDAQPLYQHLSPSAALMADSESDILVSRFRPEHRMRVVVDLKREDDLLRRYIEAGKLDFWFQNLVSSIASQRSSTGVHSPSDGSKARLTWV